MFHVIPSYRVRFDTMQERMEGMHQVEVGNVGDFRVSEDDLATLLGILRMNGLQSVTMEREHPQMSQEMIEAAPQGDTGHG